MFDSFLSFLTAALMITVRVIGGKNVQIKFKFHECLDRILKLSVFIVQLMVYLKHQVCRVTVLQLMLSATFSCKLM